MGPLRAPVFHPTGRYRLSPRGALVLLQVEEATRPMDRPQRRWRDAAPQDVMAMVHVDIAPTTLCVAAE